eukprot:1705626-Rhodomonas_salina.1
MVGPILVPSTNNDSPNLVPSKRRFPQFLGPSPKVCIAGHVGDTQIQYQVESLHPEIQYKKPQSQYALYQECGFLCSISHCRRYAISTGHAVARA